MLEEELKLEMLWRFEELKNIKILYEHNVIYKKIGKSDILSVQNSSASKYILRSSIPLIYAHWEGFFKKSIELLNKELDKNNIDFNKINNNLLASLSKDKHTEEYVNKKLLFANITINTESNLSWQVIKKFSNRYSFNLDKFTRYEHIIIQLLKARNGISHGENAYHFNNYKKIEEYFFSVIRLMVVIKNEVIMCLKNKKYYQDVLIESI